jgi:cyclic pyranopterin phosphate synthase
VSAPPLRWLELAADYRCNHRCLGCAATDHGPSRSHAQLLASLDEGRRLGIEQLWIGGGEPTLRPDLLALVRAARARGYRRNRLQTNGALLSYPDRCQRLKDAGLTEIAFSIQGADELTHDRFCRVPGAFDRLLSAIEHAKGSGLSLEADVLLYRSTTAALPALVSRFFLLGIPRFRVWMMGPEGAASAAAEVLAEEPRIAEVQAALETTLALALSHDPEHLISLHTPACRTPARARFFAPDLGLLVHDAGGGSFRLESSPLEGGSHPPVCDGCTLRPRCGGLRAGYLARHGAGELLPVR